MTYGQIRFRLNQLVPGISLDLWDGWLRDRYTAILDALRWKRRNAEAPIATEAGVGVYVLPEDCRVLSSIIGPDGALGERNEIELAGYAGMTGTPLYYRRTFDDASTLPRMQIELYPRPDAEITLTAHYVAEDTSFASASSVTLLPWVRESCIVAAAQSDALAHKALLDLDRASVYLSLSERAMREYTKYLADMKATAVGNTRQTALRLADRYQTRRTTWL